MKPELQSIQSWTRLNAIILLLATIGFLVFWDLRILALGALVSFSYYYSSHYYQWARLGFAGGPANLVTLFRVASIICLLLFPNAFSFLQIALIVLGIILLDGVDGKLARYFKTSALFGEYLDKETDAFYVLAMGALISYHELLGIWILSLGLLRYVYVLLLIFFKPPEKKESRSSVGQTIAVILMFSLMSCFLVKPIVYYPVIIITSLIVIYSFATSFIGMAKQNMNS